MEIGCDWMSLDRLDARSPMRDLVGLDRLQARAGALERVRPVVCSRGASADRRTDIGFWFTSEEALRKACGVAGQESEFKRRAIARRAELFGPQK